MLRDSVVLRRRRLRSYAPTSNTASHDNLPRYKLYFASRFDIVFVINFVFGMLFSRPKPIKYYIPSC